MHEAGLRIKLLVQSISGVRVVTERGTADRCADERKVNARFAKVGSNPFMLDLVQAHSLATDVPSPSIPPLIGGDVLDRLHRVVVENQAEREGVVSVDEKRQTFASPHVSQRGIGQ